MPRSRYILTPPGGTGIGSHPLANGLAGAWMFGESGGAAVRDMVRGYSGTFLTNLNLKPTWEGDRFGQDVFNNTDDGSVADAINRSYIQLDVDYPLLKPTGDLSVAVGYRIRHTPRNTGTWGGGYCLASKDGNTKGWFLDLYTVTGPGPRWVVHVNGSFAALQPTGTGATSPGEFALVGTYNKSTGAQNLYVNGLLQASATISTAGIDDNTSPIQFLARTVSTLPGYFDGWLRYCYIWNREVSQAEAMALSLDPYAPARRPSRVQFGTLVPPPPITAVFRRTLSGRGTRVGSRQRHF